RGGAGGRHPALPPPVVAGRLGPRDGRRDSALHRHGRGGRASSCDSHGAAALRGARGASDPRGARAVREGAARSLSSAYLPEVSEAEAQGRVAEIYEEIRRAVGLPVVNLVYRHLAVEPERLQAVWAELRPNLTTLEAERLVDRAALPEVTRISSRTLAAI